MKRLQIGLIALVLLAAAAFRYATTGKPSDAILGGLFRIGLVMGALWLSLPQIMAFFAKTPKWMLIAIAGSVLVFLLQPKLLWWIPLVVLAIWFVWSRFGLKFGSSAPGGGPLRAPRRPKRKV